MSSSLQTASYATAWRYAIDQANDLVTEVVLDVTAPDDTEVVPTQFLAAAALAEHNKPADEVHRNAAAKWRGLNHSAKLRQMRVFFNASDYTRWLAAGMSSIEVGMYTNLGVQAQQAGAHVAALVKAAADDPSVTNFLTNGSLPAHLGADFAQLGARVTNLIHSDDRARRALFEFDPSSPPNGALCGTPGCRVFGMHAVACRLPV